jgi:hypothetical protein
VPPGREMSQAWPSLDRLWNIKNYVIKINVEEKRRGARSEKCAGSSEMKTNENRPGE